MKKYLEKKLFILIHDLNPWGGQDKSTLEISSRLTQTWKTSFHSYSIEGKDLRNAEVCLVRPKIKRPVLIKSLWYTWITGLRSVLWKKPFLAMSTGACSTAGNVVQVQFVHAAWKAERRNHPEFAPLSLYHQLSEWLDLFFEKRVFQKDRHFIALSHSTAQELKKFYGIDRNVQVIHHGVDPTHYHPAPMESEHLGRLRATLGIQANEIVILLVGAYARKGLHLAMEAFSRLDREDLNRCRLLAVGSGDFSHYQKIAQELKISERVVLARNTQDICAYYQLSQIFFLPTLYEPFGMVILEAMSCGVPVLVSRSAGAAELIQANQSGLLIDDLNSAEEMKRKLQDLVRDEDLRRKLGNAARQVALNRSWDRVAQEYDQYLSNVWNKLLATAE